jgi:hypothetical protein
MAGVVTEPVGSGCKLVPSLQQRSNSAAGPKGGGANGTGAKTRPSAMGVKNFYQKRKGQSRGNKEGELKNGVTVKVGKKRELEPMEIEEEQSKEKRVKGTIVPQNSSLAGLSEQPCVQL